MQGPAKPLAGWLQKKGEKGLIRSFKKRYFQQLDDKLFYFAQKGDGQPLGFIFLPEITDVKVVPNPTAVGERRKDASATFNVHTPKRVYELLAPTDTDAAYWLNGLNDYIALEQPGPLRPKSASSPTMSTSMPNETLIATLSPTIKSRTSNRSATDPQEASASALARSQGSSSVPARTRPAKIRDKDLRFTMQATHLKEMRAAMERDVKSLQSQQSQLQSQLAEKQAALEKGESDLKAKEEEVESLQRQKARVTADLADAVQRAKEAESRISVLEQQMEEAASKTEAKEAESKEENARLHAELGVCQAQLAGAEKRALQFESDVKRKEEEKEELRLENTRIMQQVKDFISTQPDTEDPKHTDESAEPGSEKASQLPGREASLLALLLDKDARMQKKEEEANELRRVIESYMTKEVQWEQERVSLDGDLQRLRAEREDLRKQHTEALGQLSKDLEEKRSKLARSKGKKVHLRAHSNSIKKQLDSKAQDIDKKEKSIEDLRRALQKSKEREKELEDASHDMRQSSVELEEVNAELYKELDERDNKMKEMKREFKETLLKERQLAEEQQREVEREKSWEGERVEVLRRQLKDKQEEINGLKHALQQQEKKAQILVKTEQIAERSELSELKMNMLALQQTIQNKQVENTEAQRRIAQLEQLVAEKTAELEMQDERDTKESAADAAQTVCELGESDIVDFTDDDSAASESEGGEDTGIDPPIQHTSRNKPEDGPSPKVAKRAISQSDWAREKRALQHQLAESSERERETEERGRIAEQDQQRMRQTIEEMQRELFYSIAVGIKLNLSLRGVSCTQDIMGLYERCVQQEKVSRREWNVWIHRELDTK